MSRKKHLFIGRFLSLFLIEALQQALLELDKYEKRKPLSKAYLQEIYDSMKTLQDYDVKEFLRKPDVADAFDGPYFQNYSLYPHKLYRHQTICRTALLPSQVAITPGLREKALSADEQRPSEGAPVLIFDPKERQGCEGLNFDYKDYFAIRKHDGGVLLTIPNDAEAEAFPERGNATDSVLIMLCQRKCEDNLCPSNIVGLEEVATDQHQLSILVNEQPVIKLVLIEQCHLLANDAGLEWQKGEEGSGRFALRFMINEADRELQISSVIVIY